MPLVGREVLPLRNHRWSHGRWYLAVRSDTYLGFLVPGMVITLSRRTFQSRRDGRMHSGTECLVHIEMCGFSVGYAFDFRYAMEFVVTHMGTISSLDVSLRLP